LKFTGTLLVGVGQKPVSAANISLRTGGDTVCSTTTDALGCWTLVHEVSNGDFSATGDGQKVLDADQYYVHVEINDTVLTTPVPPLTVSDNAKAANLCFVIVLSESTVDSEE